MEGARAPRAEKIATPGRPVRGLACSAGFRRAQQHKPVGARPHVPGGVAPPAPRGPPRKTFPKRRCCGTAQAVTAASRSQHTREIDQALALLVPMMAAVAQINLAPTWRSDSAILSITGAGRPLFGTLSHLFSQALLLLPFGNHTFRFAIAGAMFSGVGGLATLHLCRTLFAKQGGACRLDRFLALGAALTVGLGLPWLSEATTVGGATLGGALALTALNGLLRRGAPSGKRSAVLWGMLGAALCVESLWCAAGLLGALLVLWPETLLDRRSGTWRRPKHRDLLLALLIASVLSGVHLARVGTAAPALFAPTGAAKEAWPLFGLGDWIESVGFLWGAGALFAVVFSLRDRRPLVAFSGLVILDCLAPGQAAVGWHSLENVDPNRMALHLLALGATVSLGALGMRTIAESAYALRLFAARPLALMVGVLAFAGCLAGGEDALRTLGQTTTEGTNAWTDEAFAQLPHHSLVLTKDPSVGNRLLSAQALGARPDLLVVPLGQLITAHSVRHWLQAEPELELLLRDLSVADTPSEHAIARLIDTRPVYLEPNPAWDRRLLEHILPSLPLAGFSAHAVGRSDRIEILNERFAKVDRRIRAGSSGDLLGDETTLRLYENGVADLARVLQAIPDRSSEQVLRSLLPEAQSASDASEFKLGPLAQRSR